MKYKGLWNTEFRLADKEDWAQEPIFVPFGSWPWGKEKIEQKFCLEGAKEMIERFNKEREEENMPGIPVYQGHPDCERAEVAAKYPDKGAIGWIVEMELVGEKGINLHVEWEKFPGNGFKYFSPYWTGRYDKATNTLIVNWFISVGLINRPNIKEFRLPNEEQPGCTTQEGENMEKMKELCKLLNLPENASSCDIYNAVDKVMQQNRLVEAVKIALKEINGGKDVADTELENECKKLANSCGETKKKLENAEQQVKDLQLKLENETKAKDAATLALENEQSAHKDTKLKLENESQELAKVKGLKTSSVTKKLENEAQPGGEGSQTRLALVNEYQTKHGVDFDTAWSAVKKEKPELFA